MEEIQKITIGEARIRTKFNVSGNSMVDKIKTHTAQLINITSALNEENQSSEKDRLVKLALDRYEEAAMWAVKAATA